jgi:hypothetical protein
VKQSVTACFGLNFSGLGRLRNSDQAFDICDRPQACDNERTIVHASNIVRSNSTEKDSPGISPHLNFELGDPFRL